MTDKSTIGCQPPEQKLVLAITGATGVIFGIRLLELLRETKVETHLIISDWGARTIVHETSYPIANVQGLAARCYRPKDMGAPISSGSFLTDGMIVAPCSMRTLAAIATGQGSNLVHRAADVTLKEGRRLLLAVRETPVTEIHLENMLRLSRMGVVICPPVPAFYNRPHTLDDLVTNTAQRILDQFRVHLHVRPRWNGQMDAGQRAEVPEDHNPSPENQTS
jgi:polyprenyl P-hydroxybenzoate/phenylacrylic acid decarboxylase-like protein